MALFALWVALSGADVMSTSYLTRVIVFALVGGVTGHMADRLRKIDEATRASARHFELAHEMLATANLEGYLTHVNRSWEARLGWTPEELTSRRFLEFVHPDDLAENKAAAARAYAGEEIVDFTSRYRAKDGSSRWIEWVVAVGRRARRDLRGGPRRHRGEGCGARSAGGRGALPERLRGRLRGHGHRGCGRPPARRPARRPTRAWPGCSAARTTSSSERRCSRTSSIRTTGRRSRRECAGWRPGSTASTTVSSGPAVPTGASSGYSSPPRSCARRRAAPSTGSPS